MLMYTIPNDSTPHKRMALSIITPLIHDNRGVSHKKTKIFAETVSTDTYNYVLEQIYGFHHGKFQLPMTRELTRTDDGYKVELNFAAPVDYAVGRLTEGLERLWTRKYSHSVIAYIDTTRYYTFEETMKHAEFV